MTRTLLLAAALSAGCGHVTDRDDCDASADCPAGQYCARTDDGNVCWPDGVAPAVAGATVSCGTTGCVRDGTLEVTAEVTDDREVLAVEATTDLDPAHPFALTRGAGSAWAGSIDLSALPFPALAREVVVTVRALDGARNPATLEAADRREVTRVRWTYDLGVLPTPPAVAANGDVVVGRAATSDQLHVVTPGGAKHWSLTIGSGTVTAPPSIGAEAIWVGANDGKLYAVKLDGSGELSSPTRTCTASGVAKGPPAVLTAAGADVAFGAFSSTQIVASTATSCAFSPIRDGYSAGVAVDLAGNVVGITTKTGAASVRRFSWAGSAFEELWATAVGGTVAVTPAFDADGRILTVAQDAGIDRTTTAGATATLATLDGSIDDSPIVLAGGDVVVGDASGRLHRIAPDGTAAWDPPVELGAPVHAPMALVGGPARLLVATSDGRLHALDADGAVLWAGDLTGGMALGAGNLWTPPACLAPETCTSTAYFAGADGKLYAVAIEGALDTAAPWPKAWHDPRNTSRAGGAF
jgi:hypothetical protein